MTLRILLLDDSAADAELAAAALRHSGLDVDSLCVKTAKDFAAALKEFQPDAILADHGLPQFSSLDALGLARASGRPIPFIVVTGGLDAQLTVECMRAGADDIVLKTHLDRLRPALDRAFERRHELGTLTPRQIEVLRLVAEGLSTPEIASRLGVSAKTVGTHRTEMMRRLDIHDVASLVRYAVSVGLIAPGKGIRP